MHTKYYNEKKEEVPSVTTVLKILYKDGLLEWANGLGKRNIDYTRFLNSRALMGTLVHNMIEARYKGESVLALPGREVNEAEDCVNKFMVCSDEIKISNITTEKSLSCDKYGGTLDLLCDAELEGQKVRVLGDFKTSKTVYLTQFIQLGAYLELIKINDPKEYDAIDICAIFSITKDKVIMRWLSKEDCYTRFVPMFYNLLNVYNSWNELKKLDGENSEIFKSKTF